jgi:hypothetical protein
MERGKVHRERESIKSDNEREWGERGRSKHIRRKRAMVRRERVNRKRKGLGLKLYF